MYWPSPDEAHCTVNLQEVPWLDGVQGRPSSRECVSKLSALCFDCWRGLLCLTANLKASAYRFSTSFALCDSIQAIAFQLLSSFSRVSQLKTQHYAFWEVTLNGNSLPLRLSLPYLVWHSWVQCAVIALRVLIVSGQGEGAETLFGLHRLKDWSSQPSLLPPDPPTPRCL